MAYTGYDVGLGAQGGGYLTGSQGDPNLGLTGTYSLGQIPTTTMPEYNQGEYSFQSAPSSSSSSGGDFIGGLINAGTGIVNMFTSYSYAKHMNQKLDKYRREDLQRYMKEYDDAMKQRNLDNIYRDNMFTLQQNQFDYGRRKWKSEFGLTKQQFDLNKNMAKTQMRQTQLDRQSNQMLLVANKNKALKDDLLQRARI